MTELTPFILHALREWQPPAGDPRLLLRQETAPAPPAPRIDSIDWGRAITRACLPGDYRARIAE